MPDVYENIAEADPDLVARLADALETRAADPAQRAMREAYLAEALKAEARCRAAEGRFYGQIAYTSVVAQRPD